MAWFSRSDEQFFLSTVMPDGQGGAKVAEFLGIDYD